MKFARLGVAVAAAAIVVSACSGTGATSAPAASTGASSAPAASAAAGDVNVKVGIELPMTGGEAPNGVPTANGVALALDQIKVPGFNVTINQQDDAVNGKHNADQGAKNMSTLANDAEVMFVVGPYNSSVAQAEIPVSNAAGLMQCSPANTAVGLTKGDDAGKAPVDEPGQDRLRPRRDHRRQPGCRHRRHRLQHRRREDRLRPRRHPDLRQGPGQGFTDAYKTFGGTIVGSEGVPDTTTDFSAQITKIKGLAPAIIMYGGVTTSGIGLFRKQMAQQGLTIPIVGGDGISDGPAGTASTFLNIAGPDGDVNSYSTVAAIHDIPNPDKFAADYKAKFTDPPGSYSAPGYACTQIFLAALAAVGKGVTDPAALREAVRAYVVDPQELVRHRAREGQLRRQRRHDPAHDLVLPVRSHDEGLEVPQAARLHGRPGQVAHT